MRAASLWVLSAVVLTAALSGPVAAAEIPTAGVVGAPSIPATCTGSERPQIERAVQRVASIPAGRVGTGWARDVVARAAARCRYGRFAYAVALQTARHPATLGTRGAVGRVRLRASSRGWELDPITMATAARKDPQPSDARTVLISVSTRVGGRSLWSTDPTAFAADSALQVQVARLLARSRAAPLRAVARDSARGLTHRSLKVRLSRTGLVVSFAQVVAAEQIAPDDAELRVLGTALTRRAVTSSRGTWPKLGTRWVAAAEARALYRTAIRRNALRRQSTTRALVQSLRSALQAAPKVRFERVPVQAFYPWPRDGVRDELSVAVRVDKPGTVRLRIIDADGIIAAEQSASVAPGVWNTAWDGVTAAGSTAKPGRYRWSVIAHDYAGNQRQLPGPGAFVVARDSTPPRIIEGSVRIASHTSARTVVAAGWKLEEPLSPRVTVQLILRGPRRTVGALGSSLEGSGLTTFPALPAGTYRAYLRTYDGSGNRAIRAVGTLKVG